MRTLKNILLPAGGFGTRLRGYKNPLQCKSLVTDDSGVTLLERTLTGIKAADVAERVLILTRDDTQKITQDIAERVGFPYKLINHSGLLGVRRLPVFCKAELGNEPFMLMCGHAPALPSHLRELVRSREHENDLAVSLYPAASVHEKESLVYGDFTTRTRLQLHKERIGLPFFIESPFILTIEVIRELEIVGDKHWLGNSLYTLAQRGAIVRGVVATCPPESDFPHEIESVLQWASSAVFA